jgi:hypothetical protein
VKPKPVAQPTPEPVIHIQNPLEKAISVYTSYKIL